MTIYRTVNSVYEVDESEQLARRLEGDSPEFQYPNGRWMPIAHHETFELDSGEQRLAVWWQPEAGVFDVTVTSAIQSIEPALPLEVPA